MTTDKIIDNYKIISVLGKGGMGVVYKARDINLDIDVALKMMDARYATDETFLKRFRGEARALARLHNPHIVSIYTFRETESGLCIVLEYVEGSTLADVIKTAGQLSYQESMEIIKQLLDALKYAHQAGIIHRDIKPSNIMLTINKEVKVTDLRNALESLIHNGKVSIELTPAVGCSIKWR